jgi:hypothetical protein
MAHYCVLMHYYPLFGSLKFQIADHSGHAVKVPTLLVRSNAVVMDSNPTRGLYVRVLLFILFMLSCV